MRRGGSFAYLGIFSIRDFKIDGGRVRQLKDRCVDRATVGSQQTAFSGFHTAATGGVAPARRAQGGGEDG
jgi:hypothetical protein